MAALKLMISSSLFIVSYYYVLKGHSLSFVSDLGASTLSVTD